MSARMVGFEGASRRFQRHIVRNPARISIFGFALVITLGMFLLMLPQASSGPGLGWVNALFTATSATCVTGLTVVDTAHSLSPFGQIIILILIQTGGLGIMTMSTLFLLMAGKRPSLAAHALLQNTLTHSGEPRPYSIVRDVALFSLVIEGVGSVLIFFRLLPDYDILSALCLAIFHSVSAFCNAGFSLFTNSFEAYRQDWILNLVICFLVVSGGIGFLILSELKRRLSFNQYSIYRLSFHSRLVLFTTALLLFASTGGIILMEWRNTLTHLPFHERCLAGLFQAVSSRTAGFNTLSIGIMANETLFFIILLMFIGASPGSCGGGIKTTTFASLVVLGFSKLRGQARPQIFRRSISQQSIGKAISVVMVSAFTIIVATLALLISEVGEIAHPLSRGKFLEILFEVVSAFGTVGLSTGITGGLSLAGKLVITLVMFVGRLGPLVIAIAVSRQETSHYHYAEESIMLG